MDGCLPPNDPSSATAGEKSSSTRQKPPAVRWKVFVTPRLPLYFDDFHAVELF
jgi:hypothetical protein